MDFIFVNQAYYPDTVATSQQLTDITAYLQRKHCQVSVVTSNRKYEKRDEKFMSFEHIGGIKVYRVRSTGLGKRNLVTRLMDSLSFMVSVWIKLLFLPTPKYIVACTSPPFLGLISALVCRLKGAQFIQWNYDLHPEAAVAAGYLKQQSLVYRGLEGLFKKILAQARFIVALDKRMAEKLELLGASPEKLLIIPPWSVHPPLDTDSPELASLVKTFRTQHGIENKFVVLYAGNLSAVHPIDTVLYAAKKLKSNSQVAFVFVGGGIRQKLVLDFAKAHKLSNIFCLDSQPREQLGVMLAAADMHLVVVGNQASGLVHPSKIYSILESGKPFLYLGPSPSAITDLQDEGARGFQVGHGEVEKMANTILRCERLGDYALNEIKEANRHLASLSGAEKRLEVFWTALMESEREGGRRTEAMISSATLGQSPSSF